jgi:hypothetical protein
VLEQQLLAEIPQILDATAYHSFYDAYRSFRSGGWVARFPCSII